MSGGFEVGVFSFVENTPDPATGRLRDPSQRMRDLLEEIVLADQVGLDVFGIGEHHRDDYLAATPPLVLAAAAARTERIRLTSSVTVLSADDPVRVFQDFAQLDLISRGRAEIIAGRGSFAEAFPLFGHSFDDYESLFEEKLELLLELRRHERVTWSGKHRPALDDLGVYPRPAQAELPVWVAVGGTPASAARAGRLGLPLALAIIGGRPDRFRPLIEIHRRAAQQAGHDPSTLPVAVALHGWVAEDRRRAIDEAYPAHAVTMNRVGRERGWPPYSKAQFEASCALEQNLMVGDPEWVAEKILYQHELFGHRRTMIQLTVGSLPHDRVLQAIEKLGTEVAPRVRDEIARREASARA